MQSDSPERLLRLKSIIAPRGPICVSKSSWWAGVRSGRYPAPVRLGKRITCWRERDILALVKNGVQVNPPLARNSGKNGGDE